MNLANGERGEVPFVSSAIGRSRIPGKDAGSRQHENIKYRDVPSLGSYVNTPPHPTSSRSTSHYRKIKAKRGSSTRPRSSRWTAPIKKTPTFSPLTAVLHLWTPPTKIWQEMPPLGSTATHFPALGAANRPRSQENAEVPSPCSITAHPFVPGATNGPRPLVDTEMSSSSTHRRYSDVSCKNKPPRCPFLSLYAHVRPYDMCQAIGPRSMDKTSNPTETSHIVPQNDMGQYRNRVRVSCVRRLQARSFILGITVKSCPLEDAAWSLLSSTVTHPIQLMPGLVISRYTAALRRKQRCSP